MIEHQDISRFNDPLENPLATLFPSLPSGESEYVEEGEPQEEKQGGEAPVAALNATNIVAFPHDVLAEAGLDALLALLPVLWPSDNENNGSRGDNNDQDEGREAGEEREEQQEQRRNLLWACLARLGVGRRARIDKIFQYPATQASISAALANAHQLDAGDRGDERGDLLFLAAAARSGSDRVLERLMNPQEGLIARVLTLVMSSPPPSSELLLLAFSFLDSAIKHNEGSQVAAVLRNDGALLEATVHACLHHVLDPLRVPEASVHVLAMRFLQWVFVCRREGHLFFGGGGGSLGGKQSQLQWLHLKERFVVLLETYAAFVSSKIVMEELLRLTVGCIRSEEATWVDRKEGEEEDNIAEMTILTKALLDEFEAVNESLICASRAVLLQAPSLLERAVLSRRDLNNRERSVNLFLRAGTLQVLFKGDYDWKGSEEAHVPALGKLVQVLLKAAPSGRMEHLVPLPLVRALLPVLLETTNAEVAGAILHIYAHRLPNEGSRKDTLLGRADPHISNASGTGEGNSNGSGSGSGGGGGSSGGNRSGSGGGTRSSRKGPGAGGEGSLWVSLGPTLVRTLCSCYHRFVEEKLVPALALKVLTSVMQETGEMEQEDLDLLLLSSPLDQANGPEKTKRTQQHKGGNDQEEEKQEGEEEAEEEEEGAGENLPVTHLIAKLRIVALACRSFEADPSVDTTALVTLVIRWLELHAQDKAVVDAGMQILLNLVDTTHVLLPDEVLLSSGSLNTKALLVTPPRGGQTHDLQPHPRRLSRGDTAAPLPPSGSPPRPQQTPSTASIRSHPRMRQGRSRSSSRGRGNDEEATHRGEGTTRAREESDQAAYGDDGEELAGGDGGEEMDVLDGVSSEVGSLSQEESAGSELESLMSQSGWEPTRTRLPHWVQFRLPKRGAEGGWGALELEIRDFQECTPKVLETFAGRLPPGASLPLPASSLRSLRVVTHPNHRQAGWLQLIQEGELEAEEDVVQVLISENFGADEVSTKVARFRVIARTRTSVEEVQAMLQTREDLLPSLISTAVAYADDRSFLRTVTLFLRRFYSPDAVRDLPALANSEYDRARGQAAGITLSEDGKRATFPFGPKLLVSSLDSSEGILRWVFRSSGNSSWAIGAIPTSKIDRHDIMMAEQSLAVATTGLAGGR